MSNVIHSAVIAAVTALVEDFKKSKARAGNLAATATEAMIKAEIDITSRVAVAAIVLPICAAVYGVKLRKGDRSSKNGSMMFPKSEPGEAARVCSVEQMKLFFPKKGEKSKHVVAVTVTRAQVREARQFIESCANEKVARAAIAAAFEAIKAKAAK